jgi:hypothetical protein
MNLAPLLCLGTLAVLARTLQGEAQAMIICALREKGGACQRPGSKESNIGGQTTRNGGQP